MYRHVVEFLDLHSILYSKQFGFRKNHTLAIDRNETTLGVFCTYLMRFIPLLCEKLHYYGIRNIALHWIKRYIENRAQFGSSRACRNRKISCGVPQGSILRPVLFINIVYVKVVLRPKKQFFFSLDFKTMLTKHFN